MRRAHRRAPCAADVAAAKSTWTFTFAAGGGEGLRTVTAAASPNVSVGGGCSGSSQNPMSASYTLDNTPPAVTGAPTTGPNGNGWYAADVTVAWTCSDALSGIEGDCPAATTIGGEGDSLSATASAADRAGNATTAAVAGIRIDRTPPSTSADVPAPLPTGWYAGPVRVTLTGDDGLSGVDAAYYSVDGGPARLYDGRSRTRSQASTPSASGASTARATSRTRRRPATS